MTSSDGGWRESPVIEDVYEWFAALTALTPEPGGSLLVYTELDRRGTALAMAANVAGAASLGVESDLARAKRSIRNGACDFLVNTLDEALRILKNEIRKRKAVSVVLVGDTQANVAEMLERGVQPEIVDGSVPGLDTLIARGARGLVTGAMESDWAAIRWSVAREPLRWLPVVDRLAGAALDSASTTTAARRRWLEAAPRYVGRALAGQRYLQMSAAEGEALISAVRSEVERGDIQVAVTVSRGGDEIVIGV